MSTALPVTQRGYYARQFTRVINETIKFASIQGAGCYSKAKAPGEYVATVQITLTGLKNPSEVRVFDAGTTTEVANTGAENVTTGSHSFTIGLGQPVDISVLSLGFQNMRLLNYSSGANASVPVVQVIDRQYSNDA